NHPTIQPSNHPTNTYAVVVGISDYQDPQIPDLKYAHKDAEAFANFLRSPAGGSLDEDHLKILLNEEATQARFAGALDWLWEVAGENDRVIIYFSGHGDVEKKSLTQPGYLLCWDAPSRVYMAGGAFPLPMLQEVISTISVQNKAKVMVIADACRSGKLSGSAVGGSQITGSNLAKQYANEIKILSCQPDEFSIEGEQWGGGRGAFSYHLLDGMYGMADGNQDLLVNLMEISRYLEDHVTTEVAPHQQIPMTVGGRGEKLADVFPEILAQLKEGRKGQLQLFKSTEMRGIEDDVLAAADSNVVQLYTAFKESIANKHFFEPENACADLYYEKLSQEPQLNRLHSSMRRNYAVALQDDAQQVMNTLLKTGLTKCVLCGEKEETTYKQYPQYLERAAELLGPDHYMYETLRARRFYFMSKLIKTDTTRQQLLRKAMSLQPNMPHALLDMISTFDSTRTDSVVYYAMKAVEQVPSWIVPYIQLANHYIRVKQFEQAGEALNQAEQLDTTSVYVMYAKAKYYYQNDRWVEAEKWYLKTIEHAAGTDLCFPCAYNDLGNFYLKSDRKEDAMDAFEKSIQLDSSFAKGFYNIGTTYANDKRFQEAEPYLEKALQLDSTYLEAYFVLGGLYKNTGRTELAINTFLKGLKLDSTSFELHLFLANAYSDQRQFQEVAFHSRKALEIDSTSADLYNSLGWANEMMGMVPDAEQAYRKAIAADTTKALSYINLANLYLRTRRRELAEMNLDKAMALDPQDINALNGLTGCLLMLRRPEDAIPYLLQILAQDSLSFSATTNLGNAYSMTDCIPEAIDIFKRGIQLDSSRYETYVSLAFTYFQNERYAEALPLYPKILELNPAFNSAYYFMAASYSKTGDMDKAFENADIFMENDPRDIFGFLQEDAGLELLRADSERWKALMQKHYPDKVKD
ncbi:MAG: tetratricopeptide repeat protein, partial [Bacteroidetes bacterium]